MQISAELSNNHETILFFKTVMEHYHLGTLSGDILTALLDQSSNKQLQGIFLQDSATTENAAIAQINACYLYLGVPLHVFDIYPRLTYLAVQQTPALFFDLSTTQQALVHEHLYHHDRQTLSIINNLAEQASNNNREENTQLLSMPQKSGALLIREKAYQKAQAEALYQESLITQGLNIARLSQKKLFDPQGHVIVQVTLTQKDYQDIINKLTIKQDKPLNSDFKAQLEEILGAPISSTTFCNLDISHHNSLRNDFIKWMNTTPLETADQFLNMTERSSIIPLQEEIMMHVSLMHRGLGKIAPYPQLTSLELYQVMIKINQRVQQCLQKAVKNANNKTKINVAVLNQELDKARKILAPACRQELMDAIGSTIGKEQLAQLQINIMALNKEIFSTTSATSLDYLRSDARNETATRINSVDQTAHGKTLGDTNQALRLISRTHYNAYNGMVTPYLYDHLEARVPSLAVVSEENTTAIADVAAKLSHIYQKFAKNYGDNTPTIYNLLTSLYSVTEDKLIDGHNQQRRSLELIFKGAHLYNKLQLTNHPHALVYVQNIPVNQYGKSLYEDKKDELIREASLMTDLALLATLANHAHKFPLTIRQSLTDSYQDVHTYYLNFLRADLKKVPAYFNLSVQGAQALASIAELKAQLRSCELVASLDNIPTLIIQSLFKLYTNKDNLYRNLQMGMAIQSLSIAVESQSIAGCKSANERYQSVVGRVELLHSLSLRMPKIDSHFDSNDLRLKLWAKDEYALIQGLIKIVNEGASRFHCQNLQKLLDSAYNNYNLQGSASAFSTEDQGAASKIQRMNGASPGFFDINTNRAEKGLLTNLSNEYSSRMQSHKIDWSKELLVLLSHTQSTLNIQNFVEDEMEKFTHM